MRSPNITLVSGPSGAGKTSWIRQQLSAITESAVYVDLGSGTTPIDAVHLAAEIPELTVLSDVQLPELLEQPLANSAVYIELGFHIDPPSLVLPLDLASCQRVAVLPPAASATEWHEWAGAIVTGADTEILPDLQLWRSALTGQVFDAASLNTFWYELTQGGYGQVQRAKGIFDLADGHAFYLNFVAGLSEIPDLELNLPRWLQGRPERFSGIEVVGAGLDQEAIAQTLKDCCLEEQAILYYQQQIKDLLQQGVEAA